MSMGEPMKQSTTFLVSFAQSFNFARNWLLHGDGKSMGRKFEFKKSLDFGKRFFDL